MTTGKTHFSEMNALLTPVSDSVQWDGDLGNLFAQIFIHNKNIKSQDVDSIVEALIEKEHVLFRLFDLAVVIGTHDRLDELTDKFLKLFSEETVMNEVSMRYLAETWCQAFPEYADDCVEILEELIGVDETRTFLDSLGTDGKYFRNAYIWKQRESYAEFKLKSQRLQELEERSGY